MEGGNLDLLQKLKSERDWNMSCIITDKETMVVDNGCNLQPDEIKFYTLAYEDRDVTVGEGFFVNNLHFDVHRYHPPLIYGRRGGPDDGEGIALCRYKPRNPT